MSSRELGDEEGERGLTEKVAKFEQKWLKRKEICFASKWVFLGFRGLRPKALESPGFVGKVLKTLEMLKKRGRRDRAVCTQNDRERERAILLGRDFLQR